MSEHESTGWIYVTISYFIYKFRDLLSQLQQPPGVQIGVMKIHRMSADVKHVRKVVCSSVSGGGAG